MQLMYLMVINGVCESIDLEVVYFVLDEFIFDVLCCVMKCGVCVCLLVFGLYVDSDVVVNVLQVQWGLMLVVGVQIYCWQLLLLYNKLMVVDYYFMMVGLVNFDNCLFQFNDEVNINIYDVDFVVYMIVVIDVDLCYV